MENEKLTLNQLMILSTYSGGKNRTSEIAEELSMTKQGVLYHVKGLRSRGLIDSAGKITNRGYEELYEGLSDLRIYLSDTLGRLETALTWEAIADQRIIREENVYLTMKEGYMHAGKKGGNTARGKAVNDSPAGGLLLVEDITGTVSMAIGSIKFKVIRNSDNSGKHEIHDPENTLTGTIGEGAHIFCRDRGINTDMEFGALEGAFEACTRGLDTRVFVSERRFRFTLQRIAELSRMFPRVSYTIEYL